MYIVPRPVTHWQVWSIIIVIQSKYLNNIVPACIYYYYVRGCITHYIMQIVIHDV